MYPPFSFRALYEALDAQRQARGLSWVQATKEMNGQSIRPGTHMLSASTVRATRTRAVMEGDGVLQMLRWLNRSPESFVPGHRRSNDVDAQLPHVGPNEMLRFDTRKLHAALDARRAERGMTWRQVSEEVGVGISSLTRLSKGGRTAFPAVMTIVEWLGRPTADFVRISTR